MTTQAQEPDTNELEQGQSDHGTLALLELLWRWRSILWKSTVIGFLVALIIAFVIPKQYESTTRLMPPDSQSLPGASMTAAVMGSLPAGAGGLASTLLGVKAPGAVFVGILQSRTVQDDLINRFDLRNAYSYRRYDDARKKLSGRTAIGEDTKSGIITITVTDNDPVRAQGLASSYVDELNHLVSELSTSAARRERIFLEDRLKGVKLELDEATLRLSSFSSKNMTFDPQVQGKAMLDAAATLQGQLIASETELSGLEQIYGSENARVKAARARVSELRYKLRSMSGRGESGQGAKTSSGSAELYPSLEQLPLLGGTYVDLARHAKIDEAVFEVLTKQYELAKVQEAKEIPSVKVLDAADLPEKKSFPPRLLIALAGAVLALLGAVSWSLTSEFLRRLAPEDPRNLFLEKALWSFRTRHWSATAGS